MITFVVCLKRVGQRWGTHLVMEEDAATATEYAFMLAAIVITAMGAIGALGQTHTAIWTTVGQAMADAMAE